MPLLSRFSLQSTYRLVTRSDFDGLVCAALLKELGVLGDVLFVHPADVQDGTIKLTRHDITTNLPHRAEVAASFDHHSSEAERVTRRVRNRVIDVGAGSTARVVYEHFGGAAGFPRIDVALMEAVDRADTAALPLDDVLYPSGWTLLSFLIDPRTGLGRFGDFRVSDHQMMMQLIDACLELSIGEILTSPDVVERIDLYREHSDFAAEQILRCSRLHGRVVVLDLRDEPVIHPTNRFLLYAIHPECTVSIQVLGGAREGHTELAVGRSILDRSSGLDLGSLMLAHGGGGHEAAGSCQIDDDRAESVLGDLVSAIGRAEERLAPAAETQHGPAEARGGLAETLDDVLSAVA